MHLYMHVRLLDDIVLPSTDEVNVSVRMEAHNTGKWWSQDYTLVLCHHYYCRVTTE